MTDDAMTPELPEHEIDAGTPVEALAGFVEDAPPELVGRVRRSIHRRTTVSQVAAFSWTMPFLVFLEFWQTLTEQLFHHGEAQASRKDQQP
jgi:hypothetical protein